MVGRAAIWKWRGWYGSGKPIRCLCGKEEDVEDGAFWMRSGGGDNGCDERVIGNSIRRKKEK